MASTYLRAALAGAAAAALLTTSTSGYAAWQTAHGQAPAGPSLEAGAVDVQLTAPGSEPRETDGEAGVRAVVGDVVEVAVPVTIRTGGQASSVLTVQVPDAAGDAALATELAATPSSVEISAVDGGPELAPAPDDETARLVTPAADGHTYVIRWQTSTRATRDGDAPGARNAWGAGPESLQGLSVGARPMTVSLVPAGAEQGVTARTVVPPIRMDTTALRVATAPGGSELTGLGTIPVAVAPVAVTLQPQAPLTEEGLTALLTRGQAGVEILWGKNDCDAVRWAVADGGFESDSARPTTSGEATDTIAPGESRRVCARLTSGLAQDEFVQRFAGRTAVASTRWESRTRPPASWVSPASTNALLTVPLPRPSAPPRQACTAARSTASIRWAWPAADSRPIANADGIDRWTVNARPAGGGAWTRVAVAGGGSAGRSHAVTAAALRAAGLDAGDYDLMVRAYPFEGVEDAYADSEQLWRVSVSGNRLTCGETTTNAGAQVRLGGGR